MMNNSFLFRFLLFLSNKTVTGASISPEEFSIALQSANMRHFKQKISVPEEYRPGAPFSKQAVEVTQMLTDDILPFKVHMGDPNTPHLVVDANGYGVIPSNFFYPMALSYKYFPNIDCTGDFKVRKIDVLTDQQWDQVSGSSLRKPTLEYPACNFQAGVIRFLPKNIQRVDFVYLRLPATPYYDYYIDVNGDYIYMPPGTVHSLVNGEEGSQGQTSGTVQSLSVELEWDDSNKMDILYLILSYMGINVREGQLQQFAEMSKQTGV